MTYLIDTCAFLWLAGGDPRLSVPARDCLVSGANRVAFSAASSWELAIKYRLGRLDLPDVPSRFIPEALRALSLEPLQVTHSHAVRVGDLPDHHRDPFDRLLAAQSLIEGHTIVSPDEIFDAYGVSRFW